MKSKEFLTQLKSCNVKFVIVGGEAATAHGSAYITEDLDICYARDKENLKNIVKAIKPFHPYLRGAPKGLPFIFDEETLRKGLNFTFTTDFGDIDILGEVAGLGNFDEVIKDSQMMEIYGMEFNVLTVEGLIKAKKAAGRPKDIAVVKELKAILEIKKRKRSGS